MKYKYLTGNKIYLKNIDSNDIDRLVEIQNEVSLRILGDDDEPYPMSKENLEEFINIKSPNKVFGIYLKKEDRIVGSISIHSVNQQNLNCEIGICVGEKYQHQGIGREAMNLVIDFIFLYLPMNKIKIQVFSFNEKAIALYKSLGFKYEGTLKDEIFRFATYYDLELFAILRKDWEKE